MAKGRKTGGRNFQLGESGNPKGRPSLPQDLKEMRTTTKTALERVLRELILLPMAQVQHRFKDSSVTALEAMICSVILGAIRTGDHRRVEFLLLRLIGKPESVEISTGAEWPCPDQTQFPPGYVNRLLVSIIEKAGLETGHASPHETNSTPS